MLWFDVESRYEATATKELQEMVLLWFDVESRYEATVFMDMRMPPPVVV